MRFRCSNNNLDSVKSFGIVLKDAKDVDGLPETLLDLTANAAAKDSKYGGQAFFFHSFLSRLSFRLERGTIVASLLRRFNVWKAVNNNI